MSTQEKFQAAVDIVDGIQYDGTFEPSEEMMLKFYAFHMQATKGPCDTPKPSTWSITEKKKWTFWSSLHDMPKETAMLKYIEELCKVVETMSYNEKISKFMSLMGPFYEIVELDENETKLEKQMRTDDRRKCPVSDTGLDYVPPTMSELYHFTTNPTLSESSRIHSQMPEDFMVIEKDMVGYSNSMSSSSETSNFDLLSDLSDSAESNESSDIEVLKILQDIEESKNVPLDSGRDILVATITSLQSDLEDVVKKLDNLNGLARSANVEDEDDDITNSKTLHEKWSTAGTAFAFLWPLAVELCFGSFE